MHINYRSAEQLPSFSCLENLLSQALSTKIFMHLALNLLPFVIYKLKYTYAINFEIERDWKSCWETWINELILLLVKKLVFLSQINQCPFRLLLVLEKKSHYPTRFYLLTILNTLQVEQCFSKNFCSVRVRSRRDSPFQTNEIQGLKDLPNFFCGTFNMIHSVAQLSILYK